MLHDGFSSSSQDEQVTSVLVLSMEEQKEREEGIDLEVVRLEKEDHESLKEWLPPTVHFGWNLAVVVGSAALLLLAVVHQGIVPHRHHFESLQTNQEPHLHVPSEQEDRSLSLFGGNYGFLLGDGGGASEDWNYYEWESNRIDVESIGAYFVGEGVCLDSSNAIYSRCVRQISPTTNIGLTLEASCATEVLEEFESAVAGFEVRTVPNEPFVWCAALFNHTTDKPEDCTSMSGWQESGSSISPTFTAQGQIQTSDTMGGTYSANTCYSFSHPSLLMEEGYVGHGVCVDQTLFVGGISGHSSNQIHSRCKTNNAAGNYTVAMCNQAAGSMADARGFELKWEDSMWKCIALFDARSIANENENCPSDSAFANPISRPGSGPVMDSWTNSGEYDEHYCFKVVPALVV